MNIIFPKEETQLIHKIKEDYKVHDFESIAKRCDDVLKQSEFLFKYESSILDIFIESLFKVREFEKVVSFVEELRKKDIESFNLTFYALASLLANDNFYYAKSMIKKMKILNDPEVKAYIDEDEADYGRILSLPYQELKSRGPCLILINFINELIAETLKNDVDKEYVMMRCFDLLNLLYEYGLENDIIDIFRNTIEVIYEIQID